MIVSHNLAHEGEYNYSAAVLPHLHANGGATLNLLFLHDSGRRGRGGKEGRKEKKRGDGEIFDFAEVISLRLRSEEEMWSICLINYY